MAKSMIELVRDEILEQVDELIYGPCYPPPGLFTIQF